jgi:hypothetical protein
VRDHHRVIVDVGDARVLRYLADNLVHRALGRQPDPDVKELADARLRRQVADGQPKERAVGHGRDAYLRDKPHDLLRGQPVGLEVVLAAEVIVVHPGDVRGGPVHPFGEARHRGLVPLSGRAPADGLKMTQPVY